METANTVTRAVLGHPVTPAPILGHSPSVDRLFSSDRAQKPANLGGASTRDRRLSPVASRPAENVRRLGNVVAVSRAMHDVVSLVERFAPTNITVMLSGETGTGKDVFAHAIHSASASASGPFIV